MRRCYVCGERRSAGPVCRSCQQAISHLLQRERRDPGHLDRARDAAHVLLARITVALDPTQLEVLNKCNTEP